MQATVTIQMRIGMTHPFHIPFHIRVFALSFHICRPGLNNTMVELVPIRLGTPGPAIKMRKLEQKSTRDVVPLIDPCGSMSMEGLHADHTLVARRPACCRYRLDGDAHHLSKTRRYKNTQKNGGEKNANEQQKTPAITLIGPAIWQGFLLDKP
jgi:hypothetical protein